MGVLRPTGKRLVQIVLWSVVFGVFTGFLVYLTFLYEAQAGPVPLLAYMTGVLTFLVGILVGVSSLTGAVRPGRADLIAFAIVTFSLALVLSTPFLMVKFGDRPLQERYAWETFESLFTIFIPLSGIVAGFYGWFRQQPLLAFLMGALPYSSFVFFEPRLLWLLLVPGVPLGFWGASPALFKKASRGELAEVTGLAGSVLFLAGLLLWLFFVGQISRG